MIVAQPMAPVVELATDADKEAILEVMDTSFAAVQRSSSVQRGAVFWEWKYLSSPYGTASIHLIKLEGRVAAAQSLWPMTFQWQDRHFSAIQACDTVVHPDFRRQGLFNALLAARKTRAADLGVDFIFNFPNANSLPGCLRAGWRFVGKVPWYVRVMRPISLMRDHLNKGQSVALAVPHPYHLTVAMAERLVGIGPGDRCGLSLDRPAGYWHWRYCQRPNRQYGLIYAESTGGDCAIFTLSSKSSGVIEMVVVDLIATRQALATLLRAILRCAREVGASFVAMMNPQAFSATTFYRYGFLPVRAKNLVYYPVNPALPREIGAIGHWDFRAAMHDTI